MAIKMYLFFLVIAVIQLTTANDQEDIALKNFLREKINEYPNWLLEKKLDPAPFPGEVNLSKTKGSINLNGATWNQTIEGYRHFFDDYIVVGADLSRNYFDIILYLYPLNVTGDYLINGKINGNIPVSGSGKMSIQMNGAIGSILGLAVYGFGVNSEGFVDLSVAYSPINFRSFVDKVVNFEGLEAGGFEHDVMTALGEAYSDNVNFTGVDFPVTKNLLKYLQQVFYATSLADIIQNN